MLFFCISNSSWNFCLYSHSFWSFLVSTVCHENNHATQEWRYSGNLVVVINTWKKKGFCCRNKAWPNNSTIIETVFLLFLLAFRSLQARGLWGWLGFFVTCRYLLLWWPYQVYYSKYNITVLYNGDRTLKKTPDVIIECAVLLTSPWFHFK